MTTPKDVLIQEHQLLDQRDIGVWEWSTLDECPLVRLSCTYTVAYAKPLGAPRFPDTKRLRGTGYRTYLSKKGPMKTIWRNTITYLVSRPKGFCVVIGLLLGQC